MILVRSPLRITLGGGGTDLEPYCSEHGGFCLAAAIDKYVYVAVTRPYHPGIYLKYSELEHVHHIHDIKHPIIRKALHRMELEPGSALRSKETCQIEITTLADIPAGTGLGSSSSFTTALVAALAAFERRHFPTKEIAETAIHIERKVGVTGRQDQYIAAYGGLGMMTFDEYSSQWNPIRRVDPVRLADRLLLFYTDVVHDATSALGGQGDLADNLHLVKRVGMETLRTLEENDFGALWRHLDDQWHLKEYRCPSPPEITKLRLVALRNGANGVKLIGAGKGGFLLCDTDQPTKLRAVMAEYGAPELRFGWDFEGTKILVNQ